MSTLAQLSELFYRIFLSGKVIPLRGMTLVIYSVVIVREKTSRVRASVHLEDAL